MAGDEEETGGAGGAQRLASPGRLFGLADGVFAISMTLLALDVRIADDLPNTAAGFDQGRAELYKLYGVFLLAFMVTSRFWLSNHWMLRRLHHVDNGVLERAVHFLVGICSLPVASTLLFRYASVPEALTVSSAMLAVTSLLSARLWWYLSDPRRGLSDVNRADRVDTLINALFNTLVLILAIPLAYTLQSLDVSGGYATLVWLLLPFDRPALWAVHRVTRR